MSHASITCVPPPASRSGRRAPRPAPPADRTGPAQHAFARQWRDWRRRHPDGSPGAGRAEDALRALAWGVSDALFRRLQARFGNLRARVAFLRGLRLHPYGPAGECLTAILAGDRRAALEATGLLAAMLAAAGRAEDPRFLKWLLFTAAGEADALPLV